MPNSGNLFPGTAETVARTGFPAATAWPNLPNVLSDNATDSICASGGSGSQYLVCRNFGLALAAGDIIGGITIRIEASEHSGGTEVLNAQLQNDAGVFIGTPKTITLSGTAKVVYTYGGIADLWGAALTPAVVNSANFGVRFWFTTNHDVRVDFVTAAIEYALAPVAPGGPIFPGPIFPGPIFPGPIFPGAGETVEAFPGSVQASAAVGTVLPRTQKTLPAVEVSVAVGFVTTANNVMATLSGVAATATVGSVLTARTRAITGTAATASVGSVAREKVVSLTGVAISAGTSASAGGAWGDSWGDTWGDSWGSGSAIDDPGIGIVTANTQVGSSGVQATATTGSVTKLGIESLSGVTLQTQVGFLAVEPNQVSSLIGVDVTAAVGNLIGPLRSNEVTASVGTVQANVASGLTRVIATATTETLIAGGAPLLTGVDVQVFAQSLLNTPTVNLSGVTVTVAVGSLFVPTELDALTGVDLDADVETFVPETAVALTSVDVTVDVDIVTTTADRERALTGVDVSVDAGYITAQNDVLDILTGVDVTAAVGIVRALRIKTLDSVTLSADVGTVVPIPDREAALNGVAVTVAVGAVLRDAIPLTGVAASVAVESLGQIDLIRGLASLQVTVRVGHVPKEGDVILDTVGVLVGAGQVGILGTIPAVPVGTYRHSGPMPIRKRAVKDLETLEREMALMEE